MTLDIKERIAQLNKGDVPNGYKKTEFGVFPCDWVTENRLGDLGTFCKGQGLPGYKSSSDGLPCVRYGDIYTLYNNFHFEKAQNYVDDKTAAESLPVGHGVLLFTGTGETAEEIGKCVCYNGYDTIYVGGDIITFMSDGVNPLFLAYQQYQDFSIKQKACWGQGHSVVHIQKSSLEKMPVAYPKSTMEQTRIVEILLKWDEAIDLYNQQIEKIKEYKSIFLKKIFPQEGKKVPELRFKDFTDDWEQSKLGDVGEFASNGVDKLSKKNEIPVALLNYMDVYTRRKITALTCADLMQVTAKPLQIKNNNVLSGDVFFTPTSETAEDIGHVLVIEEDLPNTVYSYHLMRFRPIPNIFFKTYPNYGFDTFELHKQMAIKAQGVQRFVISKSDFESLCVTFPSYEEQEKIANLLCSLDNLITLHQSKVDKIKKQRKVLQHYLLNGIVRV